jgi:ABC-type Fe3+/spermidine/putrescine transport system ATPase subunit
VAPAGERRETNCIEGRISEVAYFGGVTHYHVDAGFDRPVLAHVLNQNSGFAPRQGAQVVLHWQPEAAVLLPGVDA